MTILFRKELNEFPYLLTAIVEFFQAHGSPILEGSLSTSVNPQKFGLRG